MIELRCCLSTGATLLTLSNALLGQEICQRLFQVGKKCVAHGIEGSYSLYTVYCVPGEVHGAYCRVLLRAANSASEMTSNELSPAGMMPVGNGHALRKG